MISLILNTMKKTPKAAGALAVIIAAALWAVDGVALTPNLYHLDVGVVVFLIHFIPFVLMSTFLFPWFSELKKLDAKDWLVFGGVGLFGGALGTFAITKAIFYVHEFGANISVILLLQKLQPLFAITLAIILLRERPTKKFFLWAAIALAGSYFLAFGFSMPDFSLANKTNIAALFSLLAAFSWGSATVLSKRAVSKLSFQMSTYTRFAITTLLMALFILATGRVDPFSAIGLKEIIVMLIIAVTTGGGAIFIYYYGLKKIKASSSTIYELAFPVTSIILEFAIYKRFMGFEKLFGALILVFAITMLVLEKHKYKQDQ